MKVKRWVLPIFEEFWNDYIKNGGAELPYEFNVWMSNHKLNVYIIPDVFNRDIIMAGASIAAEYTELGSTLILYADEFYREVDWIDATEESIFKWYSSLENKINKKWVQYIEDTYLEE